MAIMTRTFYDCSYLHWTDALNPKPSCYVFAICNRYFSVLQPKYFDMCFIFLATFVYIVCALVQILLLSKTSNIDQKESF
jgi:hypothetical protein